jgi:hypothetical protein
MLPTEEQTQPETQAPPPVDLKRKGTTLSCSDSRKTRATKKPKISVSAAIDLCE